jgi:hypothetical protein
MSEALATIGQTSVEAYEKALILGDLAGLKPEERINYYRAVCKSVGLNPLTKPFEYTLLNGKLLLYAKRDATDQLRKIHGVSVTGLSVKIEDGIAVATCHVTDSEGRTDVATGVLSIQGLKGVDLANAMMKVETKAKRRATLSIVGLGLLDETELETIRQDETEPARQSRREVERGTLEVSREQNRGHGHEGFSEQSVEDRVAQASTPTFNAQQIETTEGIVIGDSAPTDPERARPKPDKPAAEITPLETAVLDAEVGTTRLSPKQLSENKTLPEEKRHIGAPYYRIKCIGDTLLYVYDQHLFRAVLQAKGRKKAGFMVQRGTKGLLQIKDVIHVDGVKFARDPITKDAIPADILAATEKVINSPAVPNEQETAKPASTQTAFPLGANMRSITAEIASYSDTDSIDGHSLKTKSGKPFCTVKVKHLEANPKHDPHATFQCFKEAFFGSLRAGVGKKFSWDYSVATDVNGRVWQSIESLAAEDESQEGVF